MVVDAARISRKNVSPISINASNCSAFNVNCVAISNSDGRPVATDSRTTVAVAVGGNDDESDAEDGRAIVGDADNEDDADIGDDAPGVAIGFGPPYSTNELK